MPCLYLLPEKHFETFGFARPVSIPYLTRVIFDLWEFGDFPARKFFDASGFLSNDLPELEIPPRHLHEYVIGRLYPCVAFEYVSEEKKARFWKDHIRMVKTSDLRGGCAAEHGMDRNHHKVLVESVKTEGVKTPITICLDKGNRWIVEGRHRLGAAKAAGLAEIPAFLLIKTKEGDRESEWMVTVWEFGDIVKRIAERAAQC